MQLHESRTFCLCRRAVIPPATECENQCRTYTAYYSKEFWKVKVKGFFLYEDMMNCYSRINIECGGELCNFEVSMKIPDKYIHHRFFSCLGYALGQHITSNVVKLKGNYDYEVALYPYSYGINWRKGWIEDWWILQIRFEFKQTYIAKNCLMGKNLGLELEIATVDNRVPWSEKL